jgi:hypothetical protein
MIKLSWPFSAIISGPSCCGKTVFIKKLIKNWDSVVDVPYDLIIWCYSECGSLPVTDTDLDMSKIEFYRGIPKDFHQHSGKKVLYIIDDLIMDLEKNKSVCELFVKSVHHKSISAILVLQNFFIKSNYLRTISLNAKYIVFFKSPRDPSQFNHLACQVYPSNPGSLTSIYTTVTEPPFSYLFLDLAPETNGAFRFRTDIFNKEHQTIFCPERLLNTINGFETCIVKGEQAYTLPVKKGPSPVA